MRPRLRLLLAVGLTMSTLGLGFVSTADAAQPECRVGNLSPEGLSYNSNTHADPLGTAIDEAAPGDALEVKGTCRGNFVIDKDLTLLGRASQNHVDTLDGNGGGTVLTVRGGSSADETITVEIGNLAIRNGGTGIDKGSEVPFGGSFADLTLNNSTVSENTNVGVVACSGVVCQTPTTLRDSTVSHNGTGITHRGFAGPLTLIDSTVSENDGEGIVSTNSRGGAGPVLLEDSRVQANGGAGISTRGSSATLNNSSVTDNGQQGIEFQSNAATVAVTAAGSAINGNGEGGIISVNSGAAVVMVSDSIVNGNSGPGIRSGGSITISDSMVSGNSAGISHTSLSSESLTLTNSTVIGNSSGSSGGGILDTGGSLTVTNSTVSGNSAAGDGGGIYDMLGTFSLTNSIVSGNVAAGSGGGIYKSIGSLTLTDSTVTANTAMIGGGIFKGVDAVVVLFGTNQLCGNDPDDWPDCSP